MATRQLALTLLVTAAAGACTAEMPPLSESQYALAIIPRGSTCAQLGLGNQQLTLAYPVSGTYALDAQNSINLTYYDDTNTIFFFNQSTLRITGVLVSAGDRTLMWDMPGGADAWPSLHAPVDQETGDLPEVEEVAFCYDYELYVQPDPHAHRGQVATWTIAKTGPSDVVLADGQIEEVEYAVTVDSTVSPAGQSMSGPMFVNNKSPHTVTVGAVVVMVGDLAAEVTCPVAPPFVQAPFSTTVCEFHADVPDTTDRNVVGSATVSHGLEVTTREVVGSFSSHTTTTDTADDCVTVRDDAARSPDGVIGTACTADGPATFTFSADLGPFACGAFSTTSTATVEGLDTGATSTVAWTVDGEVECDPGCTLSARYWKLHSHAGPRRYNPTWDLIGPLGEDTPFFASGKSHIKAMSTVPAGNPYWAMAKHYIATKLNKLNGAATTPAAQAAFDAAAGLFATYTPAQIGANRELKRSARELARTLKAFNNGPSRCTCKPDLDAEDD